MTHKPTRGDVVLVCVNGNWLDGAVQLVRVDGKLTIGVAMPGRNRRVVRHVRHVVAQCDG